MTHKAFLLAAGKGIRLLPITDTIPKCLVPLGRTTLLDFWLDRLVTYGIREVLINTNHLAEKVKDHLNLRPGNPRVVVTREEELLGSAGTVLRNRDFVEEEESFWVFYADNLTTLDFAAMEALHSRNAAPMTIAVYPTDQPERCGIVMLSSDHRVLSFEEKPAVPHSNLANSGIYLCRQSVFESFPSGPFIDFGFDVLPALTGRMFAYVMTEYILDIGTIQNYNRALQDWPEITTRSCGNQQMAG